MRFLYKYLIILFLTPFGLNAQTIHTLDLESSINIAKEKSYSIRMLSESLKGAEHNLHAATSSFKTHITMDMELPNYSERITSYQDTIGLTYFSDKQLSYSGNLRINQPLPTDGSLFIQSGLFNTDDYDQDEKILQLTTRLGFTQPIQSLYMYNEIKSEYEKAKTNYELTGKRLKRNELDIIFQVSRTFYDLHASKERMKIAKKSLDRQKDAYQIAENKFKAGLIREVEALQMEVDLGEARNTYDLSLVSYESQLNLFKQTLGLSLKDSIVLVSDFAYTPIQVDIDQAVKMGLDNRMELKEKQLELKLAELDIKRVKSYGALSGNINAYYDFIGIDRNHIDASLKSAIKNSWNDLKDRPGNFGVSLQLRIPILDWGENKARVKAAQTRINQNLIEIEEETMDIEREIISTVNNLHSSLRRLQLLEQNVKVAEKSFAISQSRFANGDIDTQALALDRERLDNSHVSHLEAYISYKMNLADLMRKTFFDFEKGMAVSQ
ncbi:TolC family protein [Marinifilum caeruleilacunae]|uniref:TolC family protein n=1 Tax=Marinifilum caeruleilacunae TaxID=2499076 RepID=A0ABX1WWA1_9BACT|nr:TolC family protein [Marinifilum caeruleilacunae]NOU60173.1 TolC family protein [Marinifilum caeruleilacunae]